MRRWGRGIRIRVWVCGCNGGGRFAGWHFLSFLLGWLVCVFEGVVFVMLYSRRVKVRLSRYGRAKILEMGMASQFC